MLGNIHNEVLQCFINGLLLLMRIRTDAPGLRRYISQVGFAELQETADGRANIGGTIIIGAPIIGQQLAQYILTDHQDADCRPIIRLILLRQLQACLHWADIPMNIVSPIIGLFALDRCLGYHRSTNLQFIKSRPILSLPFIYRPLIFDIRALVGSSFIDRSLLPQY